MTTTLITLVGEQPIPNLLPLRALAPNHVIFVHTGTGARGTYAARFLVTGGERRGDYKPLAQGVDVTVIELWGYRGGRLPKDDARKLRQLIGTRLPLRS